MAQARDHRREHDGRGDLDRRRARVADRLRGQRQQPEREQRREQRAEREEEALARRAPGEREPRAGGRGVDEREPGRDVPERQHRDGEREGEPDARPHQHQRAGERSRAAGAKSAG